MVSPLGLDAVFVAASKRTLASLHDGAEWPIPHHLPFELLSQDT